VLSFNHLRDDVMPPPISDSLTQEQSDLQLKGRERSENAFFTQPPRPEGRVFSEIYDYRVQNEKSVVNYWSVWLDKATEEMPIEASSLEGKAGWTHRTLKNQQKPVRYLDGKSNAYGVNSSANPMINLVSEFSPKNVPGGGFMPKNLPQSHPQVERGPSEAIGTGGKLKAVDVWVGAGSKVDLVDQSGNSNGLLMMKTAGAIIDFIRSPGNQPPVKQFAESSKFCRMAPEWAVSEYGDLSAITFVAGDYNRWGASPSIYCCPVPFPDEGNDSITLLQLVTETIGQEPRFEPPSDGEIRVPSHLNIEMIRNYMAHPLKNYIYWGRSLKTLKLVDFSLDRFTGKNEYLSKMANDPEVARLLAQCVEQQLATSADFNNLLVAKDDSKTLLDLLGGLGTNGFFDRYSNGSEEDMVFDGIYFTGANEKRVLGDRDSFRAFFVLLDNVHGSYSDSINVMKRLEIKFDKGSNTWSVEETTPQVVLPFSLKTQKFSL